MKESKKTHSERTRDDLSEIATVLAYCPEQEKLFDIFEGLYLHVGDSSEEIHEKYRFLFLILKCINKPSAESYAEVADHFMEVKNNGFLCFLSNLAVLRQDPANQTAYERAATFFDANSKKKGVQASDFSENEYSVSVIMPTYNRPRIIREAIQSVITQEFKDFELIIVNDGGDESVESTIKQFADSRIRYLRISHSGLAGALNAGLRLAKGEYISYLDDDDIYYPNHLSTLLGVASDRNKDFVYSKSRVVRGYRDDSEIFVPVRNASTNTKTYSKSTLSSNLGISVNNVLHKRELAWSVGLFNSDIPWSMDWDFWMRISDLEEPYFVDKWTSEYRKTLDNMTTSAWYQGVFYMHHLLVPYFNTGYGALTLYQSSRMLEDPSNGRWLTQVSSSFISQDELVRTFRYSKDFLFDWRLWQHGVWKNNFRAEYSLAKLARKLAKSIANKAL